MTSPVISCTIPLLPGHGPRPVPCRLPLPGLRLSHVAAVAQIIEEAVQIANDTIYGLTNYVQSQDGDRRNRTIEQLHAVEGGVGDDLVDLRREGIDFGLHVGAVGCVLIGP